MEIRLKSVEVPAFSDKKFQVLDMEEWELENVYDIERDVIKKLKKEDVKNSKFGSNNDKKYEIEHMYVDLRAWCLSEKLKKIREIPDKD
jgi:isopentenyldiphosphate isomerase